MLKLLTNAHVFAPEDRGVCHLLIAGDRIAWMGSDVDDLGVLKPIETFDLEGQRLIPGLIDGHAHLTGGGGEAGFGSRVPAVPVARFLAAGITTVVGVLGTDDTTRDTRSLVAQALFLRAHGVNAWCHTGGYHVPPVTFTGSVREDIVFLDPVIGVGEVAISDHRSSQPSFEELLRIASDAHVAGLITGKAGILHLHLGDGDRGLELVRRALAETELPPRVFNPTHINRKTALFDEALDVARAGCTVDITAFPLDEPLSEDELAADEALLRYLDSGIAPERITMSSDGGGCLPVFDAQGEMQRFDIGQPATLTDTLTRLLSRGAPLERVLPAFTLNPARLLRFHDRGRIETGAAADLVVLDHEHRINRVMTQGIWRTES
ncbi:MAG: beta-aspartyl-peptidase [Gammaproteobacteria bacterium HGW-Gammaproteobacteria-8]|nr:MAG: beta-aspartyl-peptidase [Gammaproteobacteria bacterium HGW-Gammaproteobacteria-8]